MISKNLQETVESVLENDVKSRDNDMRLIALRWHKELGDLKDLYYPFLRKVAENKVTNFESISRCRRKLQEIQPNLRGEKYIERHKRQKEMKDDLERMVAERTNPSYGDNTQLGFNIKQPEKKRNTGDYDI